MALHTVPAESVRNGAEEPVAARAPELRSPKELTAIAELYALRADQWIERVRLTVQDRWYEQLYQGPDFDVWAISWLPGQSTGFHDHGGSAGAFVVVAGSLEEHRFGTPARVIDAGRPRAFGPDYAHDVRNTSPAPAISIHAYSPPLVEMNEYELDGNELVKRGAVQRQGKASASYLGSQPEKTSSRAGAKGIEQMLASARARLRRLSPKEAFEAAVAGAVMVDIRPAAQRASEGRIAGALEVERNVLEWRFDPTSSARLPVATNHDLEIIVFCSEGYTSSLAASALQELGLWRATDIIGGFQAWRAAGLPLVAD
jgi:rhodanese-related sulfurtransferase/mannose-6-phosphate isomerase-like protein (cupin superfamily)